MRRKWLQNNCCRGRLVWWSLARARPRTKVVTADDDAAAIHPTSRQITDRLDRRPDGRGRANGNGNGITIHHWWNGRPRPNLT